VTCRYCLVMCLEHTEMDQKLWVLLYSFVVRLNQVFVQSKRRMNNFKEAKDVMTPLHKLFHSTGRQTGILTCQKREERLWEGKGHIASCLCCMASALQGKSHLFIPVLGIARPQFQFRHSCVCERFICSQDWSTYFPAAE
jgi:hypothetical protein